MDLCFKCGQSPAFENPKEKRAGTGACGISCKVCKLHVSGACSTCGAGTSVAAKEKLDAQMKLFGSTCPILDCARRKQIAHCMRDCDDFPCGHFSAGPYPFSKDFLEMQKRRRTSLKGNVVAAWPDTAPLFWDRLREKDIETVSLHSGAELSPDGNFLLPVLGEVWEVDTEKESVQKTEGEFGGEWDRQMPFLMVVYLASVDDRPNSDEMVSPRELYQPQGFFHGRYALETSELQDHFGNNGQGFLNTASLLGGQAIDQADACSSLYIFPKFRVDYALWLADEEFPASVNILLDRHLPRHMPADAIAIAINLLSRRLILVSQT